jgi:hypothetical protein
MKKLILITLLLFVGSVYAEGDRVSVRVEYKKALWTCPICGIEEIEDRPVSGGASYEHTCKNGHTFNQSGPNMKEYNGTVSYSEAEYAQKKSEDIAKEKKDKCDAWLYEVKHPAPYIEPTKADLEREKSELTDRINSLQMRIDEKAIAINR